MLTLHNVHAFYGKSHVLHGVHFDVRDGEIVALLGRNGSGRSTTVKTIMGLVDSSGSVRWREHEILGRKAFEIAHAGIGYVPENRDIFPTLTVHQNLMLGEKREARRRGQSPRWSFDDMYRMFPRLQERQHTEAGVLSGGEQQMLTIGRALMTNPRLLILDEATEGLAPLIAQEIWSIVRAIKDDGIASVIVDKNYRAVTAIADRAVILVKGAVAFEGPSAQVRSQPELRERFLGV